MNFSGWPLILAGLLLACLASFGWAMRNFFSRPAGNTRGMKLISTCGTAFAVLHLSGILWTPAIGSYRRSPENPAKVENCERRAARADQFHSPGVAGRTGEKVAHGPTETGQTCQKKAGQDQRPAGKIHRCAPAPGMENAILNITLIE